MVLEHPSNPRTRTDRGITSVLGYILITGLVIGSATLFAATGITVITQMQDTMDSTAAESAMTQFQTDVMTATYDSATQRCIDLVVAGDESLSVTNTGRIKVARQVYENGTVETVDVFLNKSLHSVVYQTEHAQIAYQAGEVWTTTPGTPDTAALVTAPDITYYNQTVTIPLVTIDSTDSFATSDGTVLVTRGGEGQAVFPQTRTRCL